MLVALIILLSLGCLFLLVKLLAWDVYVVTFVQEFRRQMRGETDSPAASELSAESAELGFLPPERQNTEHFAPLEPGLTAVQPALKAGDWRPAAELLAATRSATATAGGPDWDRRSLYVTFLGDLAAKDDGWLADWEAERPDDPDAALVRARSTVDLAWDIRGAQRAKYTSDEQFAGFRRVLERSVAECARAAELAPDDPTPYIVEIWTALGLGYPHARLDRLWAEIVQRAPYHYEAHFSALQYWCAKWRGSEELARGFAARAAADAPLGSLLRILPLIVLFEHREEPEGGGYAPENTEEARALVDAALADAAAADPDHPRLAEVRHLLAYYLCVQDRDEPALELFRQVDGYVGALPWRYRNDGAEEFCRLRDLSVAAVHG
ncbi:DUF4034 domain-containing protein [Streptomyces paludis]|uniref:DUF4034 domain-containing protein n=1 Tax=Streptomyces paludis TaxID=2282738 RepID=A0A345HS63_9ACTN|nr:DUF4034 domain-containing protein [Streptomyces paludis]AXG79537.1 DUF4034 domain-containing protein [Streptomyces paludis]